MENLAHSLGVLIKLIFSLSTTLQIRKKERGLDVEYCFHLFN